MPQLSTPFAWNVVSRQSALMEPEAETSCCASLYSLLSQCCPSCFPRTEASAEVAREHAALQAPQQEAGPSSGRLSPERRYLLPKGGPSSSRTGEPSSSGSRTFTVQQADGSKARAKGMYAEGSDLTVTPRKGSKPGAGVKHIPSGMSLASDDEDYCSTCLEGYSEENPKIWTQCSHHFHLACIYEWLNRKQTCPICGLAMSFEEIM
ncbi:hypothetical protein WJX73_010442 [Symbiochloris irregularis]|uniref:RING-type E3 ubiquitin transferase n=1 Tax=Symbiochloris irregularis TaxID=706552 RepID=A0AAW1PZG2_9CHLO